MKHIYGMAAVLLSTYTYSKEFQNIFTEVRRTKSEYESRVETRCKPYGIAAVGSLIIAIIK